MAHYAVEKWIYARRQKVQNTRTIVDNVIDTVE